MIKIFIHKDFENEKRYVFDFLFGEVFGLEYLIEAHPEQNYLIKYENHQVEINNSFFAKFSDDEKYYLNPENIPTKCCFDENDFYPEEKMPVIFGNNDFEKSEQHIYTGNDIIAGIFFMLTLWEEISLDTSRDVHNRFDENQGFLKKNKLHKRALVNEYADFLWNMMYATGFKIQKKERDYRVFLTHDIDFFARYDSFGKFIKALGGDLFKRFCLKCFFRTLRDYFGIKFKNIPDVFDKFDYFIDSAESLGLKSRFYFQPGKIGERDVYYDIDNPDVVKKINHILNRGHIVGVHPCYDSAVNSEYFAEGLSRIRNIYSDIYEGRQHFLRFKNPDTWQIWEDNDLKIDGSIAYYSDIGFRAGTCFEYPVFNVVSREQLKLRERPLILMDTAIKRVSVNNDNALEIAEQIINTVKKYEGDFVMVWHNSNLCINEWHGWDTVYLKIMDKL
jgi:hypothetical protein